MAVWARWVGQVERVRMRAAVWLLVLLIGTAISVAMPGATIFFLFGPAVALVGVAFERRSPRTAFALAVLGTLIQFVMFAELLAGIETLLVDGPVWAVAPLAALAALPALIELGNARLRPAIAALLVTAAGLWMAAMILPRSSAERPAAFGIDYFRDADHDSASWGIAAKQAPLPAGYPGEWREGVLPYSSRDSMGHQGAAALLSGADRETGCERCRRRASPRPDRPLPWRRRCRHHPLRQRHEIARARSARITETHSCDR